MSRPEFRSHAPGSRSGSTSEKGLAGSPFSQAQIMHLMKTEFARARRHGSGAACLLMEVDRLSSLVDMHGAALRQQLRAGLTKLIDDNTRGYDLLGMIQDDRFLLVLPQTSEESAVSVGNRLLEAFERLDVHVGGHSLAISLSVGVAATSSDQETMFFDTILSQAEVALEMAAAGGGGRVKVFERTESRRGPSAVDRRASGA